MKKIIMITIATACLCACNESVKYTSPCDTSAPARCVDDYHFAKCGTNGYVTSACCSEDAIAAGTCNRVCLMKESGAICEEVSQSHTVTPPPKPEPAECGNSIIESGEQCDGAMLGGHSCADRYGSNAKGDVGCDPTSCKVKYDNCVPDTANCGNGALDDGEDCDGELLRSEDCDSIIDGAAGTLKCNDQCRFDVAECRVSLCGNGIVDPGEECDTTAPENLECNDVVNATLGTLSCNAQCKLDISGCQKPKTGELCDDEKFAACDDNVFVTCRNGVITRTVCDAYFSTTCAKLDAGDYTVSGCIDNYFECDHVGDVAWQCKPDSDYISAEMTCLRDMTSDKSYWYYFDGAKVEVCPYSCDIRTGSCERLVPDQGTRCNSKTTRAYCDNNVAVNCTDNVTMSSVNAEVCVDTCGVFGTGSNSEAVCLHANAACNAGDPNKTECVFSYLVTMKCATAAGSKQSAYRLTSTTYCPNGCDPSTNQCVKLDASEGTPCTISTKDTCLDGDVLLYCDSDNKLATRACKVDGKGLCLEDDYSASCHDTCSTIGETRSTCEITDSGAYTKHEVCVEIDDQLVFETERIENCGYSCNADKTGCHSFSELEGKPCSSTVCDDETMLYCNNGKYVAYYCPMYDQTCADTIEYGPYCVDRCLKDTNYQMCYYSYEDDVYILEGYECITDKNGKKYAQNVLGDYCTTGCNEDGTDCLSANCRVGDTATQCQENSGYSYVFYYQCVQASQGTTKWDYVVNGNEVVYDICPGACNSDKTACEKTIPEVGDTCNPASYTAKCSGNYLVSCSASRHVQAYGCSSGYSCVNSNLMNEAVCARPNACTSEYSFTNVCSNQSGVGLMYEVACENIDGRLYQIYNYLGQCASRCNSAGTGCAY